MKLGKRGGLTIRQLGDGGLTAMLLLQEHRGRRNLGGALLHSCSWLHPRNSLDYADYNDGKAIARAMRPNYGRPARRPPRRSLTPSPPAPGASRAGVAARLGARDAVLRVPARHRPRDLHHQRDREPEYATAQDHQDARALPERRRGDHAVLSRSRAPARVGQSGTGLAGGWSRYFRGTKAIASPQVTAGASARRGGPLPDTRGASHSQRR